MLNTSSRRCPPAPPPPPPPRPPRRIRRDASLASLNSQDFLLRVRYRCCCGRVHLKTASFLIAALDMLSMTVAFARGVHVGRSMQHNPMAVSWFVASSLIFVLGIFSTLSLVYGVHRERHLCMLPMLVLKAFSVLVYVSTTTVFIYLMIGHSQYLLDLVAEHVTTFDYDEARTALRLGGGALVIAFSLLACAQIWFLRVLYRCYTYLQDKYLWIKCRHGNQITHNISHSPEHTNMGNGGSGRPSRSTPINGHGPSASVSNSTALTDVELLKTTPISSPTYSDRKEKSEHCYTPISDRERLWKAFDQTHV